MPLVRSDEYPQLQKSGYLKHLRRFQDAIDTIDELLIRVRGETDPKLQELMMEALGRRPSLFLALRRPRSAFSACRELFKASSTISPEQRRALARKHVRLRLRKPRPNRALTAPAPDLHDPLCERAAQKQVGRQ